MFRKSLLLSVIFCIPLLAQAEPPAPTTSGTELIPRQTLLDYLAGKTAITLIDARSPEEYAAGHIFGAINVPVDSKLEQGAALPADLTAPVVVYCKSGKRAAMLQASMLALGYTNVRMLAPAQMLWADELPVFNCGTDNPPSPQLTTTATLPLAGG